MKKKDVYIVVVFLVVVAIFGTWYSISVYDKKLTKVSKVQKSLSVEKVKIPKVDTKVYMLDLNAKSNYDIYNDTIFDSNILKIFSHVDMMKDLQKNISKVEIDKVALKAKDDFGSLNIQEYVDESSLIKLDKRLSFYDGVNYAFEKGISLKASYFIKKIILQKGINFDYDKVLLGIVYKW